MSHQGGNIEILGLPGAGKSTLQRAVAAEGILTVVQWEGVRLRRGKLSAAQLLARAPMLAMVAYLAVVTRRCVSDVHLRRVSSVLRRHVAVRALNGQHAAVLDEGPLHSLFVTLYGTRPTAVSRPLLRLLVWMLAHQVANYIYLDIDKQDCIANFTLPGRTSLRFNALTSEATIAQFRSDRTYEEIVEALCRVSASKLLVVGSVAEAHRVIAVMTVRWPPFAPLA